MRGAWRRAYDNRGAQPRVVEGPHAVDLRRRTHGGPCRAEQCQSVSHCRDLVSSQWRPDNEFETHTKYRVANWAAYNQALGRRGDVTGRCCMNRHWPARCPPTGSLPADAIRHWSAEGGHPIEDLTAEDDLAPLPGWAPGAKTISDDGLVAEERVLHPALTMVPRRLLPLAPSERLPPFRRRRPCASRIPNSLAASRLQATWPNTSPSAPTCPPRGRTSSTWPTTPAGARMRSSASPGMRSTKPAASSGSRPPARRPWWGGFSRSHTPLPRPSRDGGHAATPTTRWSSTALLHESSLARTMPTDRILTCRCDTTLVGRGRSSD